MSRMSVHIADATDVTRPSDLIRLRYGLLQMEWVQALQPGRQRLVVDAIARELLFPLAQARLGAPRLPPRSRKQTLRKRAPGGGRPPATSRHVLAGDVERALRGVGVNPGRWRHAGMGAADGELNSPLLTVLAMSWELATEVPGVSGALGRPGKLLRDLRRSGAGQNRWRLTTPPTLGDPLTQADIARMRAQGFIR